MYWRFIPFTLMTNEFAKNGQAIQIEGRPARQSDKNDVGRGFLDTFKVQALAFLSRKEQPELSNSGMIAKNEKRYSQQAGNSAIRFPINRRSFL
jgi:hypothetical protein